MKILVVDDRQGNLKVAQEATREFGDHEFTFLNSAAEALRQMQNFDVLITDFLFPKEQDIELEKLYRQYAGKVATLSDNTPLFEEVCQICFRSDTYAQIERDRQQVLTFVRNGKLSHHRGLSNEDENMDSACAYGGVLMLRAKALGKEHFLITDLHRHGSPCGHGVIILLPLIEEGIMTVKLAQNDGELPNGSLSQHYMGLAKKTNSKCWNRAIKRVLGEAV